MRGITLYIFRQLGLGTIMVGLVLAVIIWLMQSLQFLQFIITKGLSIGAWLELTLLLLPSFIAIILPAALFFVVVFVYNKLTIDRELVVVQAAGVSRLGLANPALLAAFVAVTVGYALSLEGVPASYREFRAVQWNLRANVSQVMIREGVFNNLTDGLTVYVRDRASDGELLGVLVHDTREPSKSVTLMAERGLLTNGVEGPRIVLLNGSRQELAKGTGNLSVLYFESYGLELGDIANNAGDRYAANGERSTFDLLASTAASGLPERTVARMHAEAHQRLSTPLTALGYTLIALAFLLTGGFDRRGQTERITVAVVVIVGLEAAALGAFNLASRSLTFVPLMYVVVLLPVAIGLYMIAAPYGPGRRWRIPRLGLRWADGVRYLVHGPIGEDGSPG